MLLRSLLVDIDDWDIYILATDINQKMLDRAREGTYSRWSFREEPIIPIGDYFVPTPDNRLKIEESVRMMVRFERQNLIQDTPYYYARPPSSLDLILCRNVLMYFSAEQSEKVVEQLARSLRLGGTLFVSPQEIGLIKSPDLTLVHKRTVFLHEKRERNAYACEEAFQTHYGEIYYIKSDASYPAGALSEPAQEERQIVSDVLSFHDTSLPSFICSTCTGPDTENRQFDQLIAENNLDEAARMISLRGMDFSPSTIKDIEILIRAYAGDGRYDQALGWVDRMIAFDMLNLRSYLLKAALLDEQGLVDQSLHVLRQSLYASRDYLPAHLAIAGIYSKIGQIDRARHYYEQAIRILESMDEDAIMRRPKEFRQRR
jgi:chemotaxis protein methyltransferase CheR